MPNMMVTEVFKSNVQGLFGSCTTTKVSLGTDNDRGEAPPANGAIDCGQFIWLCEICTVVRMHVLEELSSEREGRFCWSQCWLVKYLRGESLGFPLEDGSGMIVYIEGPGRVCKAWCVSKERKPVTGQLCESGVQVWCGTGTCSIRNLPGKVWNT